MAGSSKAYGTSPSMGTSSKEKRDGGNHTSSGERRNTTSQATPLSKSMGTPKDKGVNS